MLQQSLAQHATANVRPMRRAGQGQHIREYMDAIPHECEPAPIIHAYVDLNLQTLASAGLIAGPSAVLRRPLVGQPEQVTRRIISLLQHLCAGYPARDIICRFPYRAEASGGGMLRQAAQRPAVAPATPTATATVTAVVSPRSKHAEARMVPPASPRVCVHFNIMNRHLLRSDAPS